MAARTLLFPAPLDIARLAIGDRVQHELLVYDRAEKTTRDGDPYVVLTLGNASGKIDTAPVWSNQLEWAEGALSGRVVQAIGQVARYEKNGAAKRQLQLTAPVRALPHDDSYVEQFLPRVAADLTRLWDWIDSTRAAVESATLRRVLDLFYGDDEFRVRFERAPGSTSGHHAKIGGLLMHVYEVTNIARQTARTMKASVDLVVTGALLHDVGKVESYTIGPGGFTYTPCGLLVGHIVLGVMMLERRLAALGEHVCSEGQLLDLQHMLLSHHGKLEFGSPVEPMTVEAEIVHLADEASAKANDMLESLEDTDAFPDGGELSKRVWRVGRRVWRRPHDWE
jgi:3'-5' exoribonuclease